MTLTTPASAKQVRLFSGFFGSATSIPYPLADPWSVAVDDSTGDVYVTDAPDNRVEKFSSTGMFILMFGKEVDKTKSAPLSGASQEEKDVCTEVEVELGAECQKGVAGSTPGAFASNGAMFVAVDNSTEPSDPSKGDVYVADFIEHGGTGNRVSKFNSSGALISSSGRRWPTRRFERHHPARAPGRPLRHYQWHCRRSLRQPLGLRQWRV